MPVSKGRSAALGLVTVISVGIAAFPVLAQDRHERYSGWRHHPASDGRHEAHKHGPEQRGPERHWHGPMHHGRGYDVPPDRRRVYRNIRIVRPYGHLYHGYGPYRDDAAAYRFLAFTAITMALVNQLSEAQEHALETAQVRATTAPVGQTIHWNDGGAFGTVTAVRDGVSSAGRYCREFQQTVTIGGKSQQAFGTACQEPDGAWSTVSTDEG